jgi:mono/diheme cytochrome c family protein
MVNKTIALALGLLLSIGFCAIAQKKKTQSKPVTVDKTVMANGKKVYETVCTVCHQPDGGGVPGMNPPLIKTDWVMGDKAKLIGIVLKGLQEKIEINGDSYDNIMPANDYLTDQQIADVLTFVRNSFGNKASAIKAAEVKTLRGQ